MSTASEHTATGNDPAAAAPDGTPRAPEAGGRRRSLNRVLSKSEQIRDDVEECADDLSTVNATLQAELNNHPAQSAALETALGQSDGVKDRVQDCADELTSVNRALKAEVREREVLEHELLAAQAQEQAARHAAFHDPLTSLPNRVLFNDRLEHGLVQAARHERILAVMFIDLNGFKAINDTHGHLAGDAVLKTVALRLSALTRDEDTLSRHGGDEFLYLLLELSDPSDATLIAEKIIRALGEPCTVSAGGAEISLLVGASIGIAIFPADGTSAESLVRCADRAMYRAKRDRCGFAFSQETAAISAPIAPTPNGPCAVQ
jgi:diguanylate cyclase (GGDEF)-like protein